MKKKELNASQINVVGEINEQCSTYSQENIIKIIVIAWQKKELGLMV